MEATQKVVETISNLDYVIVSCGYVYRLLGVDKFSKRIQDEINAQYYEALFVYAVDTLEEEGYKPVCILETDFDFCKKALAENNMCINGTIGFKVSDLYGAFGVISILKKYKHCAYFHHPCSMTLLKGTQRILFIDYDTESG